MDPEVFAILFQISVPLVLLLLGLVVGKTVERRHFKRLAVEEAELAHIMVTDLCTLPENWTPTASFLVSGSVVIANDYFKIFAASLRNLFGGRMRSFETLVERGRREAIVRMLREAQNYSANAVWNVRIETSTLQGKNRKSPGGIELIAYGTAVRVS